MWTLWGTNSNNEHSTDISFQMVQCFQRRRLLNHFPIKCSYITIYSYIKLCSVVVAILDVRLEPYDNCFLVLISIDDFSRYLVQSAMWFHMIFFFQNLTRKKGIASRNHINILILAKCDSNYPGPWVSEEMINM